MITAIISKAYLSKESNNAQAVKELICEIYTHSPWAALVKICKQQLKHTHRKSSSEVACAHTHAHTHMLACFYVFTSGNCCTISPLMQNPLKHNWKWLWRIATSRSEDSVFAGVSSGERGNCGWNTSESRGWWSMTKIMEPQKTKHCTPQSVFLSKY